MKLYYTKGACSLVCRIIINELGLPCDYESVDLKTKQTESGKDFSQINLKGAVPTLETDDGEILTENAVILQYLAYVAHAEQLLPNPANFKHFRVLEWLNYVATELHKGIGILFHLKITPEMREQIFIPLIKAKLTYIDKNLEHNEYLVGNEFTLPDAYLFVMLTWALHFKINLNTWQNLSRYFDGLKKRDSIIVSLKQEGINLTPSQ